MNKYPAVALLNVIDFGQTTNCTIKFSNMIYITCTNDWFNKFMTLHNNLLKSNMAQYDNILQQYPLV